MLQTNSKGAVMQSLGNCMLVFQNDPLLKGSIRRNSLTERIDIEKDLGWCRSDTAVTDTDINYLRLYFEENYSITAEKNIQCALDIVANEAHYHPICDVLLGLKWDGEARICNALTRFLGVEKTPLHNGSLQNLPAGCNSAGFPSGQQIRYHAVSGGRAGRRQVHIHPPAGHE